MPCHISECIRHSHRNCPICKLPAADAGYRAAGDGGHGHFGKAVVVDGELNGRRGDFGDETASRVEYVMAYPFLLDRKSTRLNSSHVAISYAVFCLKKQNYDVGII